jgi:hypothetical protein
MFCTRAFAKQRIHAISSNLLHNVKDLILNMDAHNLRPYPSPLHPPLASFNILHSNFINYKIFGKAFQENKRHFEDMMHLSILKSF